jgi:hypothetical protein
VNICIGVLPKFEEVFVGNFGLGRISLPGTSPSDLCERCWFDWIVEEVVALIQKKLQFRRSLG